MKLLPYVVATLWLVAVFIFWERKAQLAPHHIRTVYCGRVLSDFYATNPAYVDVSTVTKFRDGRFVVETCNVTNYYWHVWKIFQ